MAASPHDVESDALLVVAAQDGDSDAFAELFRRHYPMVRRVCARKLRDLREADEVAQAAFVRAYERLDKCNGERRFGAWVQVIANNLCIDHMRAAARTTPVDEPVSEDEPIAIGPEDAVLNAEQAAMIQRALATLPDRQRDVVVARDVDGRRPPEIAAALGLSLGAVDSLLLRARRRLAASVQSMTAESGAASFMTTAAVATVGSTAANVGPLARVAGALADAVAGASYHVAAALGMVPGVQSVAQQMAPAAAAGLVAISPLGHGLNHDVKPLVDPITAPLTAAVPAPPDTQGILDDATSAVHDTVQEATDLVAPVTQSLDVPTPAPLPTPQQGLVGNVVKTVDHTVDGVAKILGQLTTKSGAQ